MEHSDIQLDTSSDQLDKTRLMPFLFTNNKSHSENWDNYFMKKLLLSIGVIVPALIVPLSISCSTKTTEKTEMEKQKEIVIINGVESIEKEIELFPNAPRIEFDFNFMRRYDISEWWLRKSEGGLWKNSFRSVAVYLWKNVGFNFTTWSDAELNDFVRKAPSDLHEIEPISNMKYSDILGSHMYASLDYWIEKIKAFILEMEKHTSSILQDGNKILIKETIDKSSTILKEIIL